MVPLPQQPTEVLIGGTLFDVKNLKHPGGSIIKFNMGTGDATEAFREFHLRSEKAQKMLKALPQRPAPIPTSQDGKATTEERRMAQMSADFAALHSQLEKEGWFDASLSHCVYRCVEIFAMHAIGVYLLGTKLWLLGLVVLGIVSGRCGWWMHEAGHFSFTGNIKLDHRLQEFFYGVGCGMSGSWWRVQHNKHHATPQKLKHDVDLDTLPLVAWNAAIAKHAKKNPVMKLWLKFQKYTFAPLTCLLVALFWQFYLHPRHIVRTKRHMELFWLGVRYALVWAIARHFGASLSTAILAYLAYDLFGGVYIFTNFALSHTHLGVVPADQHVHWLEYAATYTINIRPSLLVNWWMGYLNFQIEHHLFPSMPQYRFQKLAPRVKQLFEKNGLKYDVRGYWEAMGNTWTNLEAVAESLEG